MKSEKKTIPISSMDEKTRKEVVRMAQIVGFAVRTDQNQSLLFLSKPNILEVDDRRRNSAKRLLAAKDKLLFVDTFSELDKRVSAYVENELRDQFNSFQISALQGLNIDIRSFIESEDKLKAMVSQLCNENGFNLSMVTEDGKVKVSKVAVEEKKPTSKVFMEGELVWRRLQHWSTNVRKEKKFNIWTKGLDDDSKQKIISLALEVYFFILKLFK